ncbi:hypothetical protein EG329_004575 [Mollisiaceae sp. DMI_Dod_QoI]|nr:hypothetical protein EG329_004575 [Helotiales sp. DMI_Dod_QoI]
MKLSLVAILWSLSSTLHLAEASILRSAAPSATIKNGTYIGKYVPEWQQDQFLGIPYAIPPLGPLRFARPKSLNSSFAGTRNATQYGYSCMQYGTNFSLSEDCLTLNVIRPSGITCDAKLPVLVWIYGGGLDAGSAADPQYNVSGIAHVGQEIGKPIIVASINYRLGVWGFLQSPQILAEGSSNAGLLDQRLAFRWIKENIAAFGGDPDRITIWGESAGAQSIGLHLHSYDGRDDAPLVLYESGGKSHEDNGVLYGEQPASVLEKLNTGSTVQGSNGDFLTAYPSTLTAAGKFIHVPLLIGANSDEGTSFGVSGLDNETAIFNNLLIYRNYAISPPTARKLLELYPNDPAREPPYYITNATIFPSKGLQWRRDCAIAGDVVMISGRRKVCEEYTKGGLNVFSYRFDTPLWNAAVTAGAQHFVNVVFSFQNISGALGPLPKYQNYTDLSHNIGKAYISFVNDKDPNTSRSNSTLPYWPKYDLSAPKNMVLNSNLTYVEDDTFRKEAIDFINTIDRELLA